MLYTFPPPQKSQAESTKIAINFKKYFASLSKFRLHSDVLAVPKGRMPRAGPSVAGLVLMVPPVKVVVEENDAS